MPAEWSKHQATLMAWPTTTRAALWGELFEAAKRDYAEIARAVAAFEPVVMLADPIRSGKRDACGTENFEVIRSDRRLLGRDNRPIFVTDGEGGVALVTSGSTPGATGSCRTTATHACQAIAAHLHAPCIAPMILPKGVLLR
jgi:agmatine deiminase